MSSAVLNNQEVKKPSSLGKLFGTLKPYTGLIILGCLLGLLGVLCRLGAPLTIREIGNVIVEFEKNPTAGALNTGLITKYALIGLGAYALGSIFEFINIYIMAGISSSTSKNLRNDMINKINVMPLNYFDTRNIGDVLSYFTNDVDVIGVTLNTVLSSFVTSFATILGIIIILFVEKWQLALIALASIPVALIVLIIVGTKSEREYIKRQNYLSEVNSQAEEAYTAYNVLRVFQANERYKQYFHTSNDKLRVSSEKADFYAGITNPLMVFIGYIMVSIICLVGAWLATKISKESGGSIDAKQITLIVIAVNYANQLISPLGQIAQMFASLTQTSAAANRVFSLLDEEEQPDESNKTDTIKEIKGNISFEHVKFGYNSSRVIIKDFSEIAKSGQKVAIVGPTGAGKTTMVNLLMRFYEINSGKIAIEGVDTKTLNRSYVRGLFGMVLQDTWLFEGTFMENLKYSRRDATDEEVIQACIATHCDGFIRQQPGGYNGMITEDCGLSSGQKQLLTIARAMVQNAPMLILDEATSSVDTRTELLIQDAMDKLMKGRTSFVIAHRLSTIKNSNLILVMKDGDVIESGNHDQLMAKKGFYSELYNAQFSGKGPQID